MEVAHIANPLKWAEPHTALRRVDTIPIPYPWLVDPPIIHPCAEYSQEECWIEIRSRMSDHARCLIKIKLGN